MTYFVNPNLHLNNEVPEEVQKFIRSISREEVIPNIPADKLLSVKQPVTRRLCRKTSTVSEVSVDVEQKSGVEVIVTSDELYQVEKLPNKVYDKLKKVQWKRTYKTS